MDGAAGTLRGFGSSPRGRFAEEGSLGRKNHDIFVRAHTSVRTKTASGRRWSPKWPRHCLIFDTETTLDPTQRLNFGAFRRCKLVGSKYVCVAEGIFHRDNVSAAELRLLQKYKSDPPTLAAVEYFPAETQLGLRNQTSFVRRVFWKADAASETLVQPRSSRWRERTVKLCQQKVSDCKSCSRFWGHRGGSSGVLAIPKSVRLRNGGFAKSSLDDLAFCSYSLKSWYMISGQKRNNPSVTKPAVNVELRGQPEPLL
jgi:hypothetical protein